MGIFEFSTVVALILALVPIVLGCITLIVVIGLIIRNQYFPHLPHSSALFLLNLSLCLFFYASVAVSMSLSLYLYLCLYVSVSISLSLSRCFYVFISLS